MQGLYRNRCSSRWIKDGGGGGETGLNVGPAWAGIELNFFYYFIPV